MRRPSPHPLEMLLATGESAPSLTDKLDYLRSIRQGSPELAETVDRFLVEEVTRTREGLHAAKEAHEQLSELVQTLTAAPWYAAIYLGPLSGDPKGRQLVQYGGTRSAVDVEPTIDPATLAIGDEVLLGQHHNVIVGRAPWGPPRQGETAVFERRTPDGRLVLQHRDTEIVVDCAPSVAGASLKAGDLVRWNQTALIAYEKLERSRGDELFLEETPSESFADVGGLNAQIEEIQRALELGFRHPELAAKYRQKPVRSLLLIGPPGTGKTLLARATANWVARGSKRGRSRFIAIRPGELSSKWYGETERQFRECFRVAREAAQDGTPTVIFFDEVDSISLARGHALGRIDDKIVNTFCAELQGLEGRGNILVLSATNRRDSLDPALDRPGRLRDRLVEVPRPDRNAGRQILSKHLSADLPYACEEASGSVEEQRAAREAVLDVAISRLYATGGDAELAQLMLRDGRRQSVQPRDLINGALLAQIAGKTTERALLREAAGGEPGVRPADILEAVGSEMEAAAAVLTPGNCRAYLSELPQDVDVTGVQPVQRRVTRPHRYLIAA